MAVPAVTSAYIAPCVLEMLPSDVDLILLEFTFNDSEQATATNMADPTRFCTSALHVNLLSGGWQLLPKLFMKNAFDKECIAISQNLRTELHQ